MTRMPYMSISDNREGANIGKRKKPSYLRAIWITIIPLLIFVGIPMLSGMNCEAHKTGTYDCIGTGYVLFYGTAIGVPLAIITFIASFLVIRTMRERRAEATYSEQQTQAQSINNDAINDNRPVNRALFNIDLVSVLVGIILLPMGVIGFFKPFSVVIALVYILINILVITSQRGRRLQIGELYVVLANLIPLSICIDGMIIGEDSLMDASLYGNPLLIGPILVAILVFVLYMIASSSKKYLREISKNVLFILSAANIIMSVVVIIFQ